MVVQVPVPLRLWMIYGNTGKWTDGSVVVGPMEDNAFRQSELCREVVAVLQDRTVRADEEHERITRGMAFVKYE